MGVEPPSPEQARLISAADRPFEPAASDPRPIAVSKRRAQFFLQFFDALLARGLEPGKAVDVAMMWMKGSVPLEELESWAAPSEPAD